MFIADPTFDLALRAFILTGIGLVWAVLLIRLVGLRSLSKMTNFDFVMTVAIGSLLASAGQVTKWDPFAQILLAMAALFGIQFVVAFVRKRSPTLETAIENEPVMLMRDGEIIDAALKRTRVTKSDLMAKLREANAIDLSKVHAVVLEATGDVSVLHGDDALNSALLEDVTTA